MSVTPIPDCEPVPVVDPDGHPNCATKAAHRGLPIGIRRMVGLETAATMLGGQGPLAEALGIERRSLRAKLSADRGISKVDLSFAALALEAHAARLVQHASKLRAEAGGARPRCSVSDAKGGPLDD